DRLGPARRRQPLHADADGGDIAVFGHVDRLARDRLGVVRQEVLQQDRRPVARPSRPAGWISAFTLLKRHDLSPFSGCERIRRARPRRVRATKNPARSPARAFGEYAFLEGSRYASQAKNL